MCAVCLVIWVRCGFFLVLTAARDVREWPRAIPVDHSILPRRRHSTGVGSQQDS